MDLLFLAASGFYFGRRIKNRRVKKKKKRRAEVAFLSLPHPSAAAAGPASLFFQLKLNGTLAARQAGIVMFQDVSSIFYTPARNSRLNCCSHVSEMFRGGGGGH
jgi:hypothetical protein